MKVYQVCYDYVETYCSPYAENWTEERIVILTTLDESYAKEILAEHNAKFGGKYIHGKNQTGYINSYELEDRP